MNSILNANFIADTKKVTKPLIFKKDFEFDKKVKKATLNISALGVYIANLNGERVGDFILAPGWTSYKKRLQYQSYDITSMLTEKNSLQVYVGNGWCCGQMTWDHYENFWADQKAVIASVDITFEDGSTDTIYSDDSWKVGTGPVIFSEIYHGEIYDYNSRPFGFHDVKTVEFPKEALIEQEGEFVRETQVVDAVEIIKTPKGETVIDFGQNITGYVSVTFTGKPETYINYDHAEVLDSEGNFYKANLRTARQNISILCDGNTHTYKPSFTFQGFRYIRINEFPEEIKLENFKAIAVHSDMKKTIEFNCSSPLVNKLQQNVVWGQRDNFLDVPTDCPQRDERLGWTGDAQVFCRTASYNYDTRKFFKKWLKDVVADQNEDGSVPHVIPDVLPGNGGSSGWSDVIVICPWELYMAYGDKEFLEITIDAQEKFINYVKNQGDNIYLWNTGFHFGDWLALDIENDTYKDLLATAYYYYSTSLFIKAGKALGRDMSEYEELAKGIKKVFNDNYIKDGVFTTETQTAHVLALYFGLVDDKAFYAKKLADMIKENGNRLKTGFLGTSYLPFALSDNGYTDVAYSLLLQEKFPSWLFSVNQGATTVWEHWDSLKEDGTMWSTGMNSFNHYAYGAVASWMYSVAAGIRFDENNPGYKHFFLEPKPDARFDHFSVAYDSIMGKIKSEWKKTENGFEYSFTVPENTTATIIIDGKTHEVTSGEYKF